MTALSPKITPFLWFPTPLAQEAAEFYVSVFNNSPHSDRHAGKSMINSKSTYPKSSLEELEKREPSQDHQRPQQQQPKAGSVLTVDFTLCGQQFTALNGPHVAENPQNSLFPFNESVSFSIACEDQEEVDYYWDALTKDGGTPGECGWCKDRYSVSWQVVPKRLKELLGDGGGDAREKVAGTMMGMKKLDIRGLEDAAAARGGGT